MLTNGQAVRADGIVQQRADCIGNGARVKGCGKSAPAYLVTSVARQTPIRSKTTQIHWGYPSRKKYRVGCNEVFW
ncbi:MAG: hypothetical protein Phog2KO_49520 [Phototrophicaceae bacterium]